MKQKNEYWKIRSNILKAIESNDDKTLKDYAASDPEVFKQITNQAKNSKYRIVSTAWRK